MCEWIFLSKKGQLEEEDDGQVDFWMIMKSVTWIMICLNVKYLDWICELVINFINLQLFTEMDKYRETLTLFLLILVIIIDFMFRGHV